MENPAGNRRVFGKAQSARQGMKHAQASICMSDFKKFCHGMNAGQGRMAECLQYSKPKLSSDCRKVVEKKIGADGSLQRERGVLTSARLDEGLSFATWRAEGRQLDWKNCSYSLPIL